MITALLVLVSLAGLVIAAFGAIRYGQARRLRDEQSRWQELAASLGVDMRVREDGRPSLWGRDRGIEWELRAAFGVFARPGMSISFETADRLAPATAWREPIDAGEVGQGVDSGALERVGSEDFRAVFQVEQGPVLAGCVRWIADREVQDLLLAIRPVAAAVSAASSTGAQSIWIVLEDLEEQSVRLALEWSSRMATLAREGVAAAPPH
jgi:hypothetical protein